MLRLIGRADTMEFWEIYYQYHPRVKRFVWALVRDEWLADDLTQETFLRVQDHVNDLKNPASLGSWTFRIAYNLCRDHFRKAGKAVMTDDLDREDLEIAEESSLETEFEQRRMGSCVQDEIDRLPESLRTVMVLYDVMEFDHREIAEVLGITVQNVKVRVHRARKKLKALLERKCTFAADDRNVLTCAPKRAPEGKQ
ncbi:MAG: RNA polymerase sigma factor [Thermodesulfobacteriota bacterium]